jgi:hypothetical protein
MRQIQRRQRRARTSRHPPGATRRQYFQTTLLLHSAEGAALRFQLNENHPAAADDQKIRDAGFATALPAQYPRHFRPRLIVNGRPKNDARVKQFRKLLY